MKKSRFLTSLILLILSHHLSSQVASPKEFKSREDSEMGTTSIQDGTGKLIYNIPLLTLESEGIKLPISLSYSADGIKTASRASAVGQNWHLIAGGEVTRKMNGAPDDLWDWQGGYGTMGYFASNWEIFTSAPTYANVAQASPWKQVASGRRDHSPDTYNFSVGGLANGEFAIRRPNSGGGVTANQEIVNNVDYIDLTKSTNHISASSDGNQKINGFQISDKSGIKYSFDRTQTSIIDELNYWTNIPYTSSWLLSSIQTNSGIEAYTFVYSTEQEITNTYHSAYKVRNPQMISETALNTEESNSKTEKIRKKYLEEIEFGDYRVVFTYTNLRTDLPGHKELNMIELFGPYGRVLKKIRLVYSQKNTEDEVGSRLYLDKIEYLNPTGYNDKVLDRISFDYFEDYTANNQNTIDQDEWGYFKPNNVDDSSPIYKKLLPPGKISVFGGELSSVDVHRFSGIADKSASLTSTRAGILQAVNYKSGKTETFTYELNNYSTIASHEEGVEDYEVYANTPDEKTFYSEFTFLDEPLSPNGEIGYWNEFSSNDIIEKDQWVKFIFQQAWNEDTQCSNQVYYSIGMPGNSPTKSGVVNANQYYWFHMKAGEIITVYTNSTSGGTPCHTHSAHPLTAPKFTMEYRKSSGNYSNHTATAGGLRIKNILTSDGNGKFYKRNFSYDHDNEGSLKSSGILMSEPNLILRYNSIYTDGSSRLGFAHRGKSFGVSFFSDNPVYYRRIEESSCLSDSDGNCLADITYEGKLLNGSTEKIFEVGRANIEAVTPPYLPENEGFSKRILLKEINQYKHSLNGLDELTSQLVSQTTYEYETLTDFPSEIIFGNAAFNYQYFWDPQYDLDKVKCFVYTISPEVTRISSVTSKEYEGNNSFESVKTMTYVDDLENASLVREEVLEKNGEIFGTEFYYNDDISNYCTNDLLNESTLEEAQCNIVDELSENEATNIVCVVNQYKKESPGASKEYLKQKVFHFKKSLNQIFNSKEITRDLSSDNLSFPGAIYDNREMDVESKEILFVHPDGETYVSEENGIKTVTIRNSDYHQNLAEIKNAEPYQCFYTSFEDLDDAQVNLVDDGYDIPFAGGWLVRMENTYGLCQGGTGIRPYTGNRQLCLNSATLSKGIHHQNRDQNPDPTGPMDPEIPLGNYILSYAYRGDAVLWLGDGIITQSLNSRDVGPYWVYVERVIRVTDNGERTLLFHNGTNGVGFIDEVRLRPINSKISTTGFDNYGRRTFLCDDKGFVQHYEYNWDNQLEWELNSKHEPIKKYEYIFSGDLIPGSSTQYHDYTKTTVETAVEKGITKTDFDEAENFTLGKIMRQSSIQDGFGRTIQKVDHHVDNVVDRVSIFDHNFADNKKITFLPYIRPHDDVDDLIPTRFADQLSFYQNREDLGENNYAPYAVSISESSITSRLIEQGDIGCTFQPAGDSHCTNYLSGKTNTFEYSVNALADGVRKWTYDNSTFTAFSENSDLYQAGELKKVTTTNAQGERMIEFYNSMGQKVASGNYVDVYLDEYWSRKHTGNINASLGLTEALILSYYIYDDFGRLRFEIPAVAMERMEQFSLNGSFFVSEDEQSSDIGGTNVYNQHNLFTTSYLYDQLGRLKRKRGPEGTTCYVYDDKDRVILSYKPINAENIWDFYVYDRWGRVAFSGQKLLEVYDVNNVDILQDDVDQYTGNLEAYRTSGTNSVFGYSNESYLTYLEDEINQVSYYDDYNFSIDPNLEFTSFAGQNNESDFSRWLPTGSLVRTVPPDNSASVMLLTVTYYNDDQKIVQVFTENHKGGYDRIDSYYNDKEQLEETIQYHKYESSSNPNTVQTKMYYDTQNGRLLSTKVKINDDPRVTVSNRSYDDLGRLKELNLHKSGTLNYMQSVDYRYNEIGQLTHINNPSLIIDAYNQEDTDVFGQELMYHRKSDEFSPSYTHQDRFSPKFEGRYDGNISAMLWNAKAIEEDGAITDRHCYSYEYDGLGQLIQATYGKEKPAHPGLFIFTPGKYTAMYDYDLGGNIKRLKRKGVPFLSSPNGPVNNIWMDDMSLSYYDGGHQLQKVDEGPQGYPNYHPIHKNFIDGENSTDEYTYNEGGQNIRDFNKGNDTKYNYLGKPSKIKHNSYVKIEYLYDAVGNKLQKRTYLNTEDCANFPKEVECPFDVSIDYIGNFVYENEELAYIIHPEGIARVTPTEAENPTEFVYDYFVKDYLGNVRAVITEEDADYTTKHLATMESEFAQLEERVFDNVGESRSDVPPNYPFDPSVDFNDKVAYLIVEDSLAIGPAKTIAVSRSDTLTISVNYFFEDDAPGSTYDNAGILVNEILTALASSVPGSIANTEYMLDVANGNTELSQQIFDLMSSQIDTSALSTNPDAYLVTLYFDTEYNLLPNHSIIVQADQPNDLRTIMQNNLTSPTDGYAFTYVSNGSSNKGVSFDNLHIQLIKGKTRQLSHYYPYGLEIGGIDAVSNDWAYKYTGKELQSGEYEGYGASGLEMHDFGSRFFDPQLARWVVPDPAMQFANPYMGIGNNPVMFVDPNGEFIWIAIGVGALVGAYIGGSTTNGDWNPGKWDWESGDTWAGITLGAAAGALGGVAFHAAAPALAGTGIAGSFGTSGTIASYTLAGAATMGASGYVAGLGGGLLRSDGDWNYAHESGVAGAQFGSAVGSAIGGAFGLAKGFNFRTPEYQKPSRPEWNKPYLASGNNTGYGMSNQATDDLFSNYNDLELLQTNSFSTGGFTSSQTYSFKAGTHVQVEIKNLNILPASITLSNRSYYKYERNWLGLKKQVWPGGDYTFWLPPKGSITQDFWYGIDAPKNWSFEINAISDVVLLRINFYSNWIPSSND
jgi:RHS repeat-associated protein